MPNRVLFVCMGNICRSPAAEAVLQQAIDRSGLAIEVDSAATHHFQIGNPADPRMRAAGQARGYDLTSIARQVTREDLAPDRFDWVVAMDRDNLAHLQRLAPQPATRVLLLSEFLDDSWPEDVPDPYYGGPEGFEEVLDMLEAAIPELVRRITAESI